MADRREIFGILLSNSVIIEREARISLKKTFDSLLKSNAYLTWLAIIDRLRTETYEDVINLTGLLDELTTHTT